LKAALGKGSDEDGTYTDLKKKKIELDKSQARSVP